LLSGFENTEVNCYFAGPIAQIAASQKAIGGGVF